MTPQLQKMSFLLASDLHLEFVPSWIQPPVRMFPDPMASHPELPFPKRNPNVRLLAILGGTR
jgi:hypothetical protein